LGVFVLRFLLEQQDVLEQLGKHVAHVRHNASP
jgi:hypothetical protein